MTDTAHPSLPLSWDKYFHPLHPGVNSFPESLSSTFLFILVNLVGRSKQSVASKRKPVTIFGQLHPGTPEPPGACRVGTPRPPGAARYPAVSPPPVIWNMRLTCLWRFFLVYRCVFIKDLKMKIGRIQFWTHHCWMWPHMTQKGWGQYVTRWRRQGFVREGIFNLVTRHLGRFMGEMKRGKTGRPDN